MYTNTDYIQAALLYYKKWLRAHDIKLSQYPLSYLEAKYGEQIRQDLDCWRNCGLETIGRQALNKGKVKLPTLKQRGKFTTANAKLLDRVIKLTEPKFSKITYEEKNPYEVQFKIMLDQKEFFKNGTHEDRMEIQHWTRKFTDFLQKYAGLKSGNPLHGDVNFSFTSPTVTNWINLDDLVKEVKSVLKNLGTRAKLLRMSVDSNQWGVRFKPVFSGGYHNLSWEDRSKVMDAIREVVRKYGYNTDHFDIDF